MSVRNFPIPECVIFCISIVDIISRSVLLGLSLFCDCNYYLREGPVCYVLSFYSNYCYREVSILFLFIWLQDTLVWVHFLPLYIYLQQFCFSFFFSLNHHGTMLFSKILNLFLCDIFEFNCLLQINKFTTFHFSIIHNIV